MKLLTMFDKPYTESLPLFCRRFSCDYNSEYKAPTVLLLAALEYYFLDPINILYDLVDDIEYMQMQTDGIISKEDFEIAFSTVSGLTVEELMQLASSSVLMQSIFEEVIERGICLETFLSNLRKAEKRWQDPQETISQEVKVEIPKEHQTE